MLPWLHDTTTSDERWSAPSKSRRRSFYSCLSARIVQPPSNSVRQRAGPGTALIEARRGSVSSMMKPVTRYAAIARVLVRLLDNGTSTSIDETLRRAQDGLGLETIPDGPDERLELSPLDADDRAAANDYFSRMASAYGTKKTGVTSNGLALVLAYCVEAMQQSAADSEQSEP